MKKTILIVLLVALTGLVSAQKYVLDTKASSAQWTGYGEAGGFEQTGSIGLSSGQMIIVDGSIESGGLIFDMKNIDNDDKALVNHLKNEDFFDVKEFPTATFEMLSIRDNNITGTLTIKGISKPIDCQLTNEKSENGIELKGEIIVNRTQFEIKYNSSTYFQDLGSYAIKNEFLLEVELYFETQD